MKKNRTREERALRYAAVLLRLAVLLWIAVLLLCLLEPGCLAMDAAAAAADFAARGLRPDVICVDPPRKGLAPAVVRAAAQMAPGRIVYVSCDPATLARDVKLFAQEGYEAVRAVAVDMFPGTANVETVVRLELRKD